MHPSSSRRIGKTSKPTKSWPRAAVRVSSSGSRTAGCAGTRKTTRGLPRRRRATMAPQPAPRRPSHHADVRRRAARPNTSRPRGEPTRRRREPSPPGAIRAPPHSRAAAGPEHQVLYPPPPPVHARDRTPARREPRAPRARPPNPGPGSRATTARRYAAGPAPRDVPVSDHDDDSGRRFGVRDRRHHDRSRSTSAEHPRPARCPTASTADGGGPTQLGAKASSIPRTTRVSARATGRERRTAPR